MSLLIALDGVDARYSEYQPGARPQYFRIDALGALHYADSDDYTLCLTTINGRVPCVLLRGLSFLSIDDDHVHCPSPHTVTRYEIHRYSTQVDVRTREGVECRFTLRVLDTSAHPANRPAAPAAPQISQFTTLHPPARFRELLPGDALVLGSEPGPGGLTLAGPTIAPLHLDITKDTSGRVSVAPSARGCEFAVNGIARRGRVMVLPKDRITVGRNTLIIDPDGNLLHDVPEFLDDPLAGATTNAFTAGVSLHQVGLACARTGQLAAYLPDLRLAPGHTLALLAPEGVAATGASDVAGAPLPLAALCAGPGHVPDYDHVEGVIHVGEYQVYGAHTTEPHRVLPEQLAYVAASPALADDLTVTQNFQIAQALIAPHLGEDAAHRLEIDTLRQVGLLPLRSHRVSRLDRRERRLLAIGLDLIARPRALVLEQPFAGLDADESASVAAVLKRYAEQWAACVLYSTDSVEVAHLADQVAAFQSPQESLPHYALAYLGSAAGLMNPQLGNTPAAIMRTLRRGGAEVPVPVHAQHLPAIAVPRTLKGRHGSYSLVVAREAALSLHAPTPRWLLRRDLERGVPGVPAVAWGIGRTLLGLVLAPVLIVALALWAGHDAVSAAGVTPTVPTLSLLTIGLFALGVYEGGSRCEPLLLARDLRWGVSPGVAVLARGVVGWLRALIATVVVAAVTVTFGQPPALTNAHVPFVALLFASLAVTSLLGVAVGIACRTVSSDARVARGSAGASVIVVALATLAGTHLWQLELRPWGIALGCLVALSVACGAVSTFTVARTSQTTSNRKVHHVA
ncbi:hypothetical protein JT358_10710 [Micrococcales bacterium 31B]|nr:hypothetical protein [Micrococcales bacterium 31B]